ncbi:DNA-binding MarR family transcriptional regulator [Murinocardiopsis flavida]|uniref:DNA-binding MarR family transcriptional regulator n=1 Tax=Murinocardiopsis flavida TaxID=645275 RepID=A0A2P8DEP1_9ACTN|nr:MarR family transcriptional regulator [Murinocardiopsis flavida]PSK95694.1 DNA-binding MarR family transcriptional regulator [Murinocardiopsis flavida]
MTAAEGGGEQGGPTAWLDPLQLRLVAAHADDQAADALRGHDLTVDQWRMLHYLVERGESTMAQLSGGLGLSAPTTTRVADALVTMALAYRGADAVDRRRVLLRPSRRGRATHRDLAPEVRAAESAAFSGLAPAERDTLAALLSRALGTAPDPVR